MTNSPVTLYRWDDVPSERVTDSLTRRLVSGERTMLAHLRLDEGAVVPMHSHENEQLSWVVEGALRFVIGRGARANREGKKNGKGAKNREGSTNGDGTEEGARSEGGDGAEGGLDEIVVRAGEVLHLPSDVPHSVEALEDSVGVDIFSPPRRDWLDGSHDDLRSGGTVGRDPSGDRSDRSTGEDP